MTEHQIGELFKHYEHYLLAVIADRLYEGCPPDLVYDCLNDVFVIALEKKDDEKFNYNPPGWLTVTTQHVIDNYNRKQLNRLRFHETNFDFDLTQIPASEDWFEEIAYRVAIENKVWEKIMNELHPDDRVLLIMRYYQEMSLEDMASEIGISKNLLKVRLTRMKVHTRKLVKKYISE